LILDFLWFFLSLIFACAGIDRCSILEASSKRGEVDRDKRRESAEKQKSTKDFEKKKGKKKNLERQALETCRAKSRQRGELEEDSPDEDDGEEGDNDSDDSEWMASRLDRILEGPSQTDIAIPRTGAPKGASSGSRDGQQGEPSLHRSRADTPPTPAQGRAVSRPQPPPTSKAGHRAKSMATGPLTQVRGKKVEGVLALALTQQGSRHGAARGQLVEALAGGSLFPWGKALMS
jgi:hypothetical protein